MQIFDEGMNWYKGNLHTHTTLSDGAADPEQCIELYKDEGYHFLAITDHNRYNHGFAEEGFLVLSGIEFDINDHIKNNACHIVGIGMSDTITVRTGMSAQDMIDLINSKNGLAVVAHPYWSLLSHEDLMELEGYHSIEIWNTMSQTRAARGDSVNYADILSARGIRKLLFAVDDTHFYNDDIFGGYIMANSPDLSRRSILESILKGRFFCSQGPDIKQIEIKKNRVYVLSSEVAQTAFMTDTFYCADRITGSAGSVTITEASYTIKEKDTFLRVECTDPEGKKAWSQIIDIKPFKKNKTVRM